jgi:hypothetical protein
MRQCLELHRGVGKRFLAGLGRPQTCCRLHVPGHDVAAPFTHAHQVRDHDNVESGGRCYPEAALQRAYKNGAFQAKQGCGETSVFQPLPVPLMRNHRSSTPSPARTPMQRSPRLRTGILADGYDATSTIAHPRMQTTIISDATRDSLKEVLIS